MKFKELGKPENPVVILLHGEGLSWWSTESAARLLMTKYRVIMPILDGHGEDAETEFDSIENSAEKLIHFVDRSCGGRIFALCGFSLGAQIAAQVLAERSDIAEYAVLESALVQPGHSRAREIPKTLIRVFLHFMRLHWFSDLQAKMKSVPRELLEQYYRDVQKISMPSLIHILNSRRNFHIPVTLKDTRAKVLVLVGSRETIEMKFSCGLLKKAIPNSRMVVARGMRHGELSISHSQEYVRLLEEWFSKKTSSDS
ncbi:MAG: Alpha/beta hydrolase [Oscillospiraceae bacterium]|jgi:pimeloyl-ACP methyl ester carboxylesterase